MNETQIFMNNLSFVGALSMSFSFINRKTKA